MVLLLLLLLSLIPCGALEELLPLRGNRSVSYTHIPKTGGTSLESELYALQNATPVGWAHRLGGHERCFHHMFDESAFNIILLRSPRAHVLSQFLECRYDAWGRSATRGTGFEALVAGAEDEEAFGSWVAHFQPGRWALPGLGERGDPNVLCRHGVAQQDCHGDFNCYHPADMAARQLGPRCAPSPHHAYASNYPLAEADGEAALRRLARYEAVGVTELFPLTWCLLSHQLGVRLPSLCTRPGGARLAHITHGVPPSAALAARVPAETWAAVDQLTRLDARLYAAAYARLLAAFDAFNAAAPAGARLGTHLLLPSAQLGYLAPLGVAPRAQPPQPPPAPDEAFLCARLPQPADVRPEQRGNVASSALEAHAARAPGAQAPFACQLKGCDALTKRHVAGPAASPAAACSWQWDGESTVGCGAGQAGWALDWSHVVLGMPVQQRTWARTARGPGNFLDRVRSQAGNASAGGAPQDAWFDVPGLWFADAAFRAGAKLLLLGDCFSELEAGMKPRRKCANARTEAGVAELRARGVDVRLELFGGERNKTAAGFFGVQTMKTRALFAAMAAWRPDAHFYVKMDDDVLLFPARLLHFLRTLEAAVGVAQPIAFGHRIRRYLQGHMYGLNGAAVALLADAPAAEWEAAMEADGGLDKEDQVVSALLEARGVPRLHCGHFVAEAAAYASSPTHERARGWDEHPKTRAPISLHKMGKLGPLKDHVPDRLCQPDPADEDWTWRC